MTDRLHGEALFLKHLDWIGKVAARICAHYGMGGTEAEDFAGWIKTKLIEDDYAVLRRFRGDSELKTYLASLVVRYFHEYQRQRWGRWRPSAAAVRLGPPASQLEGLVRRDGYSLQQAGEKLRIAGLTTLSDAELARLLEKLPERPPLRPVEASAAVLKAVEAPSRTDERVTDAEADARRRDVMGALGHALERLEPEERMIVRMHFMDGRILADVARALHVEQKPLYRRAERLRARLREYLAGEGVSGADVREVFGEQEAS